MVGIGASKTLVVLSAGTVLTTVKATETQCGTEIIVCVYSEDGVEPQQRLRKTDAQYGGSHKLHARRASIERTTKLRPRSSLRLGTAIS